MIVAVSACLLGENCKYNGGNNYSQKVMDFVKDHQVIAVCPEVLGGLPVPRPSAEIVNGIVTNTEGKIVHREFCEGADLALQEILENKVELVILQSRSPSCGVKQIYDGSFSRKLIPGKGIFARMLEDAGIQVIDVEDL